MRGLGANATKSTLTVEPPIADAFQAVVAKQSTTRRRPIFGEHARSKRLE